jgi:hypothetical protein
MVDRILTEEELLFLEAEDARKRAAYRTRSFRDVSKGLFRRHRLGVSGAIATASFPTAMLSQPITFMTEIEVSGVAAEGIVFEYGDSTTGVKLWIEGADTLAAAAGDGTPASNGGADGSATIAGLGTDGFRLQLVMAVSPGKGELRVWADGHLVIREDSVAAMTSNTWAASSAGVIAGIENGTSNSRSTVDITAAPTDFAVVRSLETFIGQLPKQMNENLRAFA